MKYGQCTNLPDACEKAKKKELLPISGQDSTCPECGSRLMAVNGGKGGGDIVSKDLIRITVGVALSALLLFGGWKFIGWLEDGDGRAVASGGNADAKGTADNAAQTAGKDEDGNTVILRLSGSNTIGEKLAPRLAMAWIESIGGSEITLKHRCRNGRLILHGKDNQKALAKRCGDAEYNPENVVQAILNGERVAIDVRAHGSSSAFEALASAENSTDIGMSSRKIKPEEALSLKNLGDMESLRSEHVIGLDGIAVIAHRNRPLDAISIQDLRRIFTGEIEYWPGSGTPGQRIQVHARDDISGTYDTFKSIVLGRGDKLVPSARRYEDSGALAAAVAADENAIGFVGLAYVTGGVRAIPVSASNDAAALSPTEFTVKKEDYALSRRLYFYTAERPSNRLAVDFVDFASSSRGQAIVDESGFVDLKPLIRKFDPSSEISWERPSCVLSEEWPGARNDYCDLIEGKREMSVSFRFLPGSDDLDNRARKDLLRVLEDLENQPDGDFRIALIGFADSDGAYRSNIDLSKRRSQRVVRALESLGITDITVHAFGEEISVGNNGSDVGKEKNRRVEVWLY